MTTTDTPVEELIAILRLNSAQELLDALELGPDTPHITVNMNGNLLSFEPRTQNMVVVTFVTRFGGGTPNFTRSITFAEANSLVSALAELAPSHADVWRMLNTLLRAVEPN